MNTRSQKQKDGSIKFYTGRKKATQDEVKAFIKVNYLVINPDTVTAEQRRYLGAVKGGKKRQENALRSDAGSFIDKKTQAQLIELMGINIEAVKDGIGYGSYDEMFKDRPDIVEKFDKVKGEGLTKSRNKGQIRDKIKDFKGKVFINGVETTKENAARRVNTAILTMNRTYGTKDASVKFRYKGIRELNILVPTKGQITAHDDYGDFLESGNGTFDKKGKENTWGDEWEIYGSP